ncbi:MAG: type II secretion system protein [Candidatus Omnitrophota bacterium]
MIPVRSDMHKQEGLIEKGSNGMIPVRSDKDSQEVSIKKEPNGLRQRGFLLFEVVISIVIITTGLLFIMRSYTSSKDSIIRAGEVSRAILILESKMWEFEVKGEVEGGGASGDFKKIEGYKWELEADALEESETFGSQEKLYAVTLSVFKDDKRGKNKYTIWTYLKGKPLQ